MPGRSSSSERRCRKHAARYCSDDGPDIGSVLPFDSESPQVTSSTSVGDQWGEGPAICEGIPFQMTRKVPQAKAWTLDGHGRRAASIHAERVADGSRFVLGPGYKTLWYEIKIE